MNLLIPVFSPVAGTWGGLTRVLAIAEAAQQAGHRVAFCASGYVLQQLEQRSYRVFPTPATTYFGFPAAISERLANLQARSGPPVKGGRDFGDVWFVLLLSGMARSGYLTALLDAERRATGEFHPDFIFTDLDPGAFLLAAVEGLPIAAAFQTPLLQGTGSLPWRLMDRAVAAVLRPYQGAHRPVHEIFYGPHVLKIIPSIPALEGIDARRRDVCYVGQLLGTFQQHENFQAAPERRYVFVYLGTGSVPLDAVRRVLPVAFPADNRCEVLVGTPGITSVERIGSVEMRPFVPAAAVLGSCDWTICHGGQNTIIQSLMNGVPLMIFPGPIFERRYNARKVRDAGAGIIGEIDDFNAGWIRRALDCRTACAQQAAQLGEQIRDYGGARAAIAAMESWPSREAAVGC